MALDDAWMRRAACRGIENPDAIFFPPTRKGVQADTSTAKAICYYSCPVQRTCLVYAIAHKEMKGVWGGYTETERRRIPRETKVKLRRLWFSQHPTAGERAASEGR